VREILGFYEDTMFWGQDWGGNPFDCMHFQMSYNTYGNPHTQDFINRKIRSDGFSTFRRGSTTPPPPVLSREDRYALAIIAEGQRLGITPRGIIIGLSVALVETNLTMYANSNDPESLNFPHDAVGSDHLSSGLFQQQPSWGPLADRMDPTRSATIFFTVDNGGGVRGLTKIRDANGNLYDYNSTANSMGFYAQTVQGSAFGDRYDQRMGEATDLYNRLVGITAPPPPLPGDDMALVPQDQWDTLFHAVMNSRESRSPLREPGEGAIGDTPSITWNVDGSIHVLIVHLLAKLGEPSQVALLNRVAATDLPERQQDAMLAQAILADMDTPAVAPVPMAPLSSPPPVADRTPVPVAMLPAVVDDPTEGELIGRLFENLKALRLADALPIEGRAPLAALIAVLNTKNGSTL
jgi:hypothetical protein